MPKSVLLIAPPQLKTLVTPLPSFVEEGKGDYPPLGILYVAGYLRKSTKHQVKVLDAQIEGLSYEDIKKEIARIQPDIVGIQTLTFTLVDVLTIARLTKEVSKDIHVCLGGPHTILYPEETLTFGSVDSLVIGEGEIAFAELVDALDKGMSLGGVQGVAYKDKNDFIINDARPMMEDLNLLPYPARDLTPYKKYNSILSSGKRITTMITSRGCPFRCIFCNRKHFGKACRFVTAEHVVNEMEECKTKYGVDEIFIYDDTFTLDRERAMRICDLLIERDSKLTWDIRTRVDLVDKELMVKLKKAGCSRIHFGVESGLQEMLDILGKGITPQQAKEAFKLAKEVGMITLAYFMIGVPSETEEKVYKTIDFAIELDADFFHLSVVTPFPGTELYDLALQKGIFKTDHWREFAIHPDESFIPRAWEGGLTQEDLFRLTLYAYKKYYMRPKYIIKRLITIRSLRDLKRHLVAGLRLLSSRYNLNVKTSEIRLNSKRP